ncbi:MAG: tRNA guanosine(15) transglycosylase TgtA [Candidatus Lokiarchaeota archaeon]|nr:tRNA guanosine(15) transglycosylase TgtA [Candidatus Lokiarchaeota archaeon]
MKFEIYDTDILGRIGEINLNGKKLKTPNLFPVIHPYRNILDLEFLKKIGVHALFTNSYTLYQNEKIRNKVLKKGLHDYLEFDGFIATDSGAFQQYMYNESNIEINAQEIELFQEKINSNFPVILDIPVQLDDDYDIAKNKILINIKRAKENIERRSNSECSWFGPIHGGRYFNLLKQSCLAMNKLDFNVYAIGGLVKAYLEYRFNLAIKILLNVKKSIRPDKPIHMFGLGLPQFFALAIACGCDLMDSAAYILYAKEKRYFSLSTGTSKLDELHEFPCSCPICNRYNPKEVRNMGENMQVKLLAKHNLYLSFSELRTVRQAIKEGNLWELVEQRIRAHPNLVEAAKIMYNNAKYFECFEKIYKKHGRLLSSIESVNRPIFKRYSKRLMSRHRIPEKIKFLIILPEVDTTLQNSPFLTESIKNIYSNDLISSDLIQIMFTSSVFGVLPLEWSYTFPMGQYEVSNLFLEGDLLWKNFETIVRRYFKINSQYFKKCGLFAPKNYENQYCENVELSTDNFIYRLYDLLKPYFNGNLHISPKIDELIAQF